MAISNVAAPAQKHATDDAVYTALLIFSRESRLYKRVCPSVGRLVRWYTGVISRVLLGRGSNIIDCLQAPALKQPFCTNLACFRTSGTERPTNKVTSKSRMVATKNHLF